MDKAKVVINDHQYILDIYPGGVLTVGLERNKWKRLCLVFHWMRQTQFSNIYFFRIFTIHLGHPWVRYVSAFSNIDDPREA